MTVYFEVIFISNCFIDFFIFALTLNILKRKIVKKRIIIASVLGGLLSAILPFFAVSVRNIVGKSGEPGQLKGKFTDETLGEIKLNCSGGVYSKSTTDDIPDDNLTEIALKNEIKQGQAQILCTLDGSEPELFSCNVTFKSGNYNADTQNMIVTVTDERLMDISGGIVQGLSGSPILQNGKLIGAVTHVLVDDPKKGYGIFAENMLENAETAAKEDLKEAS